MSALNIKAIKSEYLEFTNFTGTTPNFTTITYLNLTGSFDSETSAARYIVDSLIKDWDAAKYGTVPTFFKVETLTSKKIFEVRPVVSGETADYTSPSQGDYFFQVYKTFS